MIEDIKFNLITNDGKEKNFIIIDKFEKNNKNYLLYQEENKEEIYASLYEVINDNIKLIPIENEKDYDIVDDYLENL